MEIEETLPETVVGYVENGEGHFYVDSSQMGRGDCHGFIMDTPIGATRVMMKTSFYGSDTQRHDVVCFDKPRGVLASHIIGKLAKFAEEIGGLDGTYEVIISVWTYCCFCTSKTRVLLTPLADHHCLGARGLDGRLRTVPGPWQLERALLGAISRPEGETMQALLATTPYDR